MVVVGNQKHCIQVVPYSEKAENPKMIALSQLEYWPYPKELAWQNFSIARQLNIS